jgi:hypothetical protein
MTPDRKVRDVLRVLDSELDSLLLQIRYASAFDEPSPAKELEKLVGTAQAKRFIQDEIDDCARRRKAVRRAVVAKKQTENRKVKAHEHRTIPRVDD